MFIKFGFTQSCHIWLLDDVRELDGNHFFFYKEEDLRRLLNSNILHPEEVGVVRAAYQAARKSRKSWEALVASLGAVGRHGECCICGAPGVRRSKTEPARCAGHLSLR